MIDKNTPIVQQIFVHSKTETIYVTTDGVTETTTIEAPVGALNSHPDLDKSVVRLDSIIRPPTIFERKYFGLIYKITFTYTPRQNADNRQPLSGKSLMLLTDWVPSAAVRKRQKKLIADEIAEINEFRAADRIGLARWRCIWLALHWTRYLLGAPVAAAARLFRKTSAS